jgi:hypothetical protein
MINTFRRLSLQDGTTPAHFQMVLDLNLKPRVDIVIDKISLPRMPRSREAG